MNPAENNDAREPSRRPADAGAQGAMDAPDSQKSLGRQLFALRAEFFAIDKIQREKQALLVALKAELKRASDFLSTLQSASRAISVAHESSRQCVETSRILLDAVPTSPAPTKPAPRIFCDSLTKQEARVIGLVASGETNKEIGHELSISVKTVEFHRASALKKLHLRSRAEVVRYALGHGWLGKDFEAQRTPARRAPIDVP
jgi:DNA-binding CsgD family transcriptional regulator